MTAQQRVMVQFRYQDADGSSKRFTTYGYGRTKTDARRAAKAKADVARQRLAAGAPVRDDSRTLASWLEEWRTVTLKVSDRAAATKHLYAGLTRRHVEPEIGAIKLGNLRPIDVTRLLKAMAERGASPSTMRNTYAALRGALEEAVHNGLLATNPVAKVRRPAPGRHEALALDPNQTAAFLEASTGLRYATALRLCLGTGLRRGEVLALRWDDLALDRRELRVSGSLTRGENGLAVSAPKTVGSRRRVALSPQMVQVLRGHRASQVGERLLAGNQWEDSGFVFTTALGHPVDPRNLLRETKLAAARADLGGVNVHTLRHTYATTALLEGFPGAGGKEFLVEEPVPRRPAFVAGDRQADTTLTPGARVFNQLRDAGWLADEPRFIGWCVRRVAQGYAKPLPAAQPHRERVDASLGRRSFRSRLRARAPARGRGETAEQVGSVATACRSEAGITGRDG